LPSSWWFDQTIDRVADRFTASTHAGHDCVALMVAFGIQLDTLALVNRLSTDPALRQSSSRPQQKSIKGKRPWRTVGVFKRSGGLKSGEDQKGSRGKAQKQPATPNRTAPMTRQ